MLQNDIIQKQQLHRIVYMDRDIPMFNRPVVAKIQKKNLELHHKRLKSIKSGSNRTMPMNGNHNISNKKAIMVEEQKKTEIEKQNVLLFNKMMKIMKRADPNNQPRMSIPQRSRTGVNYSRITEQNRFIFQRLQQQRPTISNKKLQEERAKNVNILRFLGKYPNLNTQKTSYDSANLNSHQTEGRRKINSTSYNRGYVVPYELDEDMYEEDFQEYEKNEAQKMRREHEIGTASGKRKFLSQAIKRKNQSREKLASQQSEKNIWKAKKQHIEIHDKSKLARFHQPQILLYQRKMEIIGRPVLVQFFRLYNQYQIIANFDQKFEGKNQYELIIPEKQGTEFFSHYNYDYEAISKMLVIEDSNLVISLEGESSQESKSRELPVEKITQPIENDANPLNVVQMAKYQEALDQIIE